MIRIDEGILTIHSDRDGTPERLTGPILPCPAPTCPCKLVFLVLAPPDRPDDKISCGLDLETRMPAPIQGPRSATRRGDRIARQILALLDEDQWEALEDLLREAKAGGIPGSKQGNGGGTGLMVMAGELPQPRNAPCLCGSGKKYKRCCARNADAPFWITAGKRT